MAPRSRLSIAKADIIEALATREKVVFSKSDLEGILSENRSFWRLAMRTTVNEFIQFLIKNANLRQHNLRFPRPVVRYTIGDCGHLEIIQSVSSKGYFSHYTAMHLHGLTEQIPKSVYFNNEQNLRPGGGELTQAGINRSFASQCRITKNIAEFRELKVYLLNGGNTGQLGVFEKLASGKTKIRTTNLERTLIDITVRPVYSGGIFEVAKAFAEAADSVSVNRICAYLRKIGYTYPYHQSIGFYLERSGKYTESQISQLEEFEVKYDFMLDYKMEKQEYVKRWRLYIPKGF
jgi:hypothetical protein